MTKRFPEWVNTSVVVKAIKMREEGILSKQLNLWIENLLEIEKNCSNVGISKHSKYVEANTIKRYIYLLTQQIFMCSRKRMYL